MSELSQKLALANREIGRSVVYINPHIEGESKSKIKSPLYFGIKDTDQIPDYVMNKIRSNSKYLCLTVDKASNRGRAIDTDLINPITYRAMTGSTSGGPINILKGINDFAIGTDGGGSILAPALSCQLPSIMGAGLGIFVKNQKRSTDGILFTGSVGFIGKNVSILKELTESILDTNLIKNAERKLTIVIPKKGSVICPDGQDMHEKVMHYLTKASYEDFKMEELDMSGIDQREQGMKIIQKSFTEKNADLILTCEGPVDLYGYGETIPQMLGNPGIELTRNHGKYLIRSANLCQTTAITVPIETLASGIVIIAKQGLDAALHAFDMADRLEKAIHMPEIWKRYYIEDYKYTGLDLH